MKVIKESLKKIQGKQQFQYNNRFVQKSRGIFFNTITCFSEKAEGILSKAVKLWPILQRPFAQDPVDDAIETEGFRGKIYTYLIEK